MNRVKSKNGIRCLWDHRDNEIHKKSKLIILNESQGASSNRRNIIRATNKLQIIKQSDRKEKQELRCLFNPENVGNHQNLNIEIPEVSGNCSENYIETIDCTKGDLPILPAGTIIIKKDGNSINENNNITNCNTNSRNNHNNVLSNQNSLIESEQSFNTFPNNNVNSAAGKFETKQTTTKTLQQNLTGTNKKKDDKKPNNPKLLVAKRQHIDLDNFVPGRKKIKYSDIPYINTRSITKKMSNIGATNQIATVQHTVEFRKWPVHGMHDRPIYDPQIGLSTEFQHHHFTNVDELSYATIPQSSVNIQEIPKNSQSTKQKKNLKKERKNNNSLKNCMYDTLNAVLGYSAQVSTPYYRSIIDRAERIKNSTFLSESSELNLSDSLQKLNINDCDNDNSKVMKNYKKLQQVLERDSDNALVLWKIPDPNLTINKKNTTNTNDNTETYSSLNTSEIQNKKSKLLKHDNKIVKRTVVFSKSSRNTASSDSVNFKKEHFHMNQQLDREVMNNTNECKAVEMEEQLKNDDIDNSPTKLLNDCSNENHIRELIQDTALLYCTLMGVHQDELANFIKCLDAKQCIDLLP